MTKSKTPSQKLTDALAAEYVSYNDQWDALNKARREQFTALHETQKKAILDALSAWDELRQSYGELCSPSFDDVCKADNALINLRFHFNADDK